MQCFDDATTFSPLQVLFLYFFQKFSGFLLTLFTLPCIFTQNLLCEVMLTLLRWSYFVILRTRLSKYSNSLVVDAKKEANVECFKAINAL